MKHYRPSPIVLATALIWAVACSRATAAHSSASREGGKVITAAQIERSGSHTAWEVLKHEAPMLSLEEDRNGRPVQMHWRGRSSIYLEDAPMVVLDGVPVPDWRSLAQIPAREIETINIMTGIEGTTYYGTNAASGVIEIKTKSGPQS